jgi:type 1 fimbria pilin
MKKIGLKGMLSVAGLAFLLGAAGVASAATTAGSMTISGTLTDSAPPASCAVVSMPTIDASFEIPVGGIQSYTKISSMTLNCTAGLAYNISVPVTLNPLVRGSNPEGLTAAIHTGNGVMISEWIGGQNRTGTGANEVIPVHAKFQAEYSSNKIMPGETGAVSGTVVLSIKY